MRWLLVTLDFPPAYVGGIASWTHDLASALAGRGHEVTVLARSTGGTSAHDRGLPYEVVRMAGRSWGRWQGVWAAAHAARAVGRIGTRDLRVVCATWRLAWPLARAPWPAGTRLAIAAHGSELSRLASPPTPFVEAMRRVDAILPLSVFLADELGRLGVADKRVRVLPVALPLPPPIQTERSGLCCLCRLTPLKGVDRAIGLARAIGEPLTVIGDGPAAAELRRAGPDVRFLGELPRPEALAELARSRAAVLLPRVDTDGMGAEGLGIALLEAASLGVPAIGCRTGGVPEAVGPGLVLDDPGRAGEADIERVRALLADPDSGERARAWVAAHHGPERAVDTLQEALA